MWGIGEEAYAATAAVEIPAGSPIAQYAAELTTEGAGAARSNMYLYELDADELRAHGYAGGDGLRLDASSRGGEARFINDRCEGTPPSWENMPSQAPLPTATSSSLPNLAGGRRGCCPSVRPTATSSSYTTTSSERH